VIDPRAVFYGVIVDQLLTLVVPWLVPRIDLEALAAAGAASTMLGGYVAGRVATSAEWLQGGAVGVIALAIGLLSGVERIVVLPRWYVATVFLAVVPAGALGGLVARGRKPFDARRALV